MSAFTRPFFTAGTLLILGTTLSPKSANAQSATPAGTAVRIWAVLETENDEGSAASLTLSSTVLPSTVNGTDGTVSTLTTISEPYGGIQAPLCYSDTKQFVRVTPYKTYSVSLSGDNVQSGTFHVQSTPGYRVFINETPTNFVACYGYSTVEFRVEPSSSPHPEIAGMLAEVAKEGVGFRLSLGTTIDGNPAGDLVLSDPGTKDDWGALKTAAALECDSMVAQVTRLNNVIQSVATPGLRVEVVTINSSWYEIHCYNSWSSNNAPHITYRIQGGPSSTSLRFTREYREVTGWDSNPAVTRREWMTVERTGTWPNCTLTRTAWTPDQESAIADVVIASSGTVQSRSEVIAARSLPSEVSAISVTRNYAEQLPGEMLVSEVVGTQNPASASFSYHVNGSLPDCGHLSEANLAGGNWVAFDYYTDYAMDNNPEINGKVKRRYRPHSQGPIAAAHVATQGAVEYYEYTVVSYSTWWRKFWPSLVQTTVDGTTTAKSQFSYEIIEVPAPNSTYTKAVRTTGSTYYSVSAPVVSIEERYLTGTDPEKGDLYYAQQPDGTAQSWAYQSGWWDGSSFGTGTPPWNATDGFYRISKISGTSVSGASRAQYMTHGNAPVRSIWLEDGKSTFEATIRNSHGFLIRTETSVWGSGSWRLVSYTNYTNDFCGRLVYKVSSDGAAYSATWDGDRRVSETDETGVTTTYTYDRAGGWPRSLALVRRIRLRSGRRMLTTH